MSAVETQHGPELAAFAFPLPCCPGLSQASATTDSSFSSSFQPSLGDILEALGKFGRFCANCLAAWKKLSLESYVRGGRRRGTKGCPASHVSVSQWRGKQ